MLALLVPAVFSTAVATENPGCTAIANHLSRLQCFDKEIPRCMAIASADKRLTCLDAVTAVRVEAVVSEAMRPLPAARQNQPDSSGIRLGVGGGSSVGDHAGRFKLLHGDLDLHSFAGSSGPAFTAQVWWDDALAKNWTVGAQWLRIQNTGTASLTLPYLIVSGTRISPVAADAKVRLSADLAFVNIAYRPMQYGRFHPFIGAGLGGGYGRASLDYSYQAFGSSQTTDRVASPIGAAQAFMGLDFDITRSVYFTLSPTAVLVTGHPIGIDQRYLDVSMLAAIGARLP